LKKLNLLSNCLNTAGGEVFEHVDSDVHADSRDSEEMALRTAEKLLKVQALFIQ
jgi:hypothetical protein